MKQLRTVVLLSMMLLIGASMASATTIIDWFTGTQGEVCEGAACGVTPNFSSLNVAGVLGGNRDMEADHTGGTGTVRASVDLNVPGMLDLETSSSATGRVIVQWDGSEATAAIDPTGLGSIDLTEGGTNWGFLLRGVGLFGSGSLSLTIWDNGVQSATVTRTIPGDNTPRTYSFLFTEFGVPATNVGAIQLVFAGNVNSFDGDVDFLLTGVPEPTVMFLMGGGLIAIGLLRRRRS